MRRPKGIKTKKSVSKRFKITATGKVIRSHAGRRHLAHSKNAKINGFRNAIRLRINAVNLAFFATKCPNGTFAHRKKLWLVGNFDGLFNQIRHRIDPQNFVFRRTREPQSCFAER